jgi:hypothetical protein
MIFGDPRVPFSRPASATPGYVPRSMDAGFIPTDVGAAMPQILLPQFVRLPSGVHQPISAEPGSLPPQAPGAVAAAVTAQPPSATAIKQRSMRLMSPALVMALGIMPPPRAGNIRSGLEPNAFINKGRNPGV